MCVFLLHHCIHPVICCPEGCLVCECEQLFMKIRYKKYTIFNMHKSVYYIRDSIKREKEKRNGRHCGKSFPNSVHI